MELEILHMIQGWHSDWLSDIMIFFSAIGTAVSAGLLYLFVHYPTDVWGGMLQGTLDAMLVYACLEIRTF